MAALSLFPARVRFVNDDGTLTMEAYRALQIIFNRVGGSLGNSGADVFGQVFGVANETGNLSIFQTDVVQPTNSGNDSYTDVAQTPAFSNDAGGSISVETMQAVGMDMLFPDVVQSTSSDLTGPITSNNGVTSIASQTGTGTKFVVDTSPTLITPKATTTLGVGNATPAASGSGVSFPAVQSASTDVNTLDDYEEGNWTPNIGGTTVTYTLQEGRYVKVGQLVFVQCKLQINALGDGSTSQISGLPFTSLTTSFAAPSVGSMTYFSGIATAMVVLSPYVGSNSSVVQFNGMNAAAVTTTHAGLAPIAAATRLDFSLCYRAAS